MNEKEFWASMKRDKKTGCLLWQRGRTSEGYGKVLVEGVMDRIAHRVAWVLTNGEIPTDQMYDLHHRPTCKKTCCEISHLTLMPHGEHAELSHALGQVGHARGDRHGSRVHPERLARGNRNGSRTHPERLARGERNGQAKITDAQVAEIRTLRRQGLTQKIIASLFGINRSHVSRIEHGGSRLESLDASEVTE